jgi:hypothetical protein
VSDVSILAAKFAPARISLATSGVIGTRRDPRVAIAQDTATASAATRLPMVATRERFMTTT